ncbi:MAG: hypothetical protein LBS84_04280, partial [Clostridiales bacterium]|nr:hypothetical protein [Clostridiales bacterium]
MYRGSAYASFLTIMTAVFLLITAQLSITSAELRVSRMNERYSGLYDIGVSAAEAQVKAISAELFENQEEILQEYMLTPDWPGQDVVSGEALTLAGDEFRDWYQAKVKTYVNAAADVKTDLTHESGVNIAILVKYRAVGTAFGITVTNKSTRPVVKNMADNTVNIECIIKWNSASPVYSLTPLFDVETEPLDGKDIYDFSIERDPDYKPV